VVEFRALTEADIPAYLRALLDTAAQCWDKFAEKFMTLWQRRDAATIHHILDWVRA
jgi:hypothetical protein